MYEDNRTIDDSGLLTQRTQSSYVPKPVHFGLIQTAKPAPTHVNPNKEMEWQKSMQERQLEIAEEGLRVQKEQARQAKKKKGGKVICTRYHDLGYLDDEIYAADEAFGEKLLRSRPDFVVWYWSWAVPLVHYVLHGETLKSRIIIHFFWPWCRAWATEMACREGIVKRGSLFGKALMAAGEIAYKITRKFKLYPTAGAW